MIETRYTCQCEGTIAYNNNRYLCLKCGAHFRELPTIYCVKKGKGGFFGPALGHQVHPKVKGEPDAQDGTQG